ncbi:MAG TPA: hypothetical protein VHO84_13240, partial [Syntrophorhabdaceae bacterium]|nr:hypothetical protein [Syntrophorhabdaceae bacterium]
MQKDDLKYTTNIAKKREKPSYKVNLLSKASARESTACVLKCVVKKLNVLNSCIGFSTVVDLGIWSEKKLDRLIRES